MDEIKKFQVWAEGYAATGERGTAQHLVKEGETDTEWPGRTFHEACINALRTLKWDMKHYDNNRNTYWACRFFDNEKDARKSFG